MKKYRLTILFILIISGFPWICEADRFSSRADSLRMIISNMDEGTQKADNLLLLALTYYDKQSYDSAEFYSEKARILSLGLDYKKGLAESIFRKGLIQNKRSDFNAAMNTFREYISIVEPLNNYGLICSGYYYYGLLLKKQGKIDSAIFCYNKCLEANLTLNDTARYIAIYNALGNIYQDAISQYDSAAYYYLKTIRLCQASKNEILLGKVYDNLGKTFTRLGEYSEANSYLLLALEQNRLNGDARGMSLNLSNIGCNYLVRKELDSAIFYFDQAMDLLAPYGEILEKIDLYHNYAVFYKEQGNYELALLNYNKALVFYRSQSQAEGTMITLKNIGDIYKRQKKYDLALVNYDSSLAIARRTGYKKNERDILYSFFQVYHLKGDFKKAFEFQSEYLSLQDSLFSLDKTIIIKELTLKYEKEQDQAQILALENESLLKDIVLKEKTLQRNAFLYSGIIILALAVFLFLYINQKRRKDKIIARQKIIQLEEEKQLLAAKSLVEGQEEERKRIANELHDGLGVLLSATKMQFSAIRDTNPENIPLIKKAIQLLEQATGDVRVISHNMMPGLLTKLGFYEAVEDLFEQLSDSGDLHAECIIHGEQERLPENKEIMLYRIIQEVVNNTLKHAAASHIKLEIQVSGDKLEIIFSDNGKGFNVEEMMELKSLGLKSIQSRVDFLNGELRIRSGPGAGTHYKIQVPYH